MNLLNQKILFIHTGGLGDIILLSPVLETLRNALDQNSQLDLLVETRAYKGSLEFFSAGTVLNNIKSFDFKSKGAIFKITKLVSLLKGYDTVISSGSSPLVAVLLWLSGAKRRIGYNSKLSFLLTDPIRLNKNQYTSQMLSDLISPITIESNPDNLIPNLKLSEEIDLPVSVLKNTNYFLIHPGVSKLGLQKNFIKSPGTNYWVELINELTNNFPEIKTVLIGGPDDKEVTEAISQKSGEKANFLNLSNQQFNLLQLAKLIKDSTAFICVDSAPMHLGVAVNANVIALFGPTDPKKLIPQKNNFKVIKVIKVQNLLCQPCLWNRRKTSCALPICVSLQNTSDILRSINHFK